MSEIGKIILTVVVTAIVGAILALVGSQISGGGIVRLVGGISTSQLGNASPFDIGANCPDHREATMTVAKNSFCYLTNVSIRPGSQTNKDGWEICRIEVKSDRFVLIAEMYRSCTKPEEHPEIACHAKCIEF
jgi:hypothetical protein